MKLLHHSLRLTGFVLAAGLLVLSVLTPETLKAQSRPPQRVIRTYIPPDQLVSFLPSTPFPQFVEFLNPIVERVTGKRIVDPETRAAPIDIAISGMHFLDAFELVLEYHGLRYRETDQYFILESPPAEAGAPVAVGAVPDAGVKEVIAVPATADSREVTINAVLFDLNLSRAREVGLDWNALFGEEVQNEIQEGEITVRTGRFFDGLDDVINVPAEMSFKTLTQLLRALETEGLGRTVASPHITVQSGENGRIQIGSDVPFQTRDFAGNTLTQFFSTGTIVDVTPTLLTEPVGEDSMSTDLLDFIHMKVRVEKSNSRPSTAGMIIDRNEANTKVLLLPGEQTIIGGLYSTDEMITRRGVPILKDLPGWFFGLRYLFGTNSRNTVQRELLIVLQADVLDALENRSSRPFDDELLDRQRRRLKENIRRVDEGAGAEVDLPDFSTGKPESR